MSTFHDLKCLQVRNHFRSVQSGSSVMYFLYVMSCPSFVFSRFVVVDIFSVVVLLGILSFSFIGRMKTFTCDELDRTSTTRLFVLELAEPSLEAFLTCVTSAPLLRLTELSLMLLIIFLSQVWKRKNWNKWCWWFVPSWHWSACPNAPFRPSLNCKMQVCQPTTEIG